MGLIDFSSAAAKSLKHLFLSILRLSSFLRAYEHHCFSKGNFSSLLWVSGNRVHCTAAVGRAHLHVYEVVGMMEEEEDYVCF